MGFTNFGGNNIISEFNDLELRFIEITVFHKKKIPKSDC